MLPWILCALFASASVFLTAKLFYIKKSINQICILFGERLSTDTNTLITVSSGDKDIRFLAESINKELRVLRRQQIQYLKGDKELKEAVANISHDLRTPLTAISGYLELLETEHKSEAAQRYISFIRNRTEALKQLTEELFRYTVVLSAEKPKLENTDIRAVLEESILSFWGVLVERGIAPTISLPDVPVVKQLDKSALSRVFGNIINNVLKYSDGDLCVELEKNGKIIFSNMASGLDGVQVGKLFNRFFTVETAHNSTGLGLSISKALVEQMEGTIRAEYENDRLSIVIEF